MDPCDVTKHTFYIYILILWLTFKATKQWFNNLEQDSDLFNCLTIQGINWNFNMSLTPWWGGFYSMKE